MKNFNFELSILGNEELCKFRQGAMGIKAPNPIKLDRHLNRYNSGIHVSKFENKVNPPESEINHLSARYFLGSWNFDEGILQKLGLLLLGLAYHQ